MRILDLFAGIGGFSLGLHRASKKFKTVAFCEQDPFCTQILNKHWPDVPVYPDIRGLTYEKLKADGVVADSNCKRSSEWTNQKESGERSARVKSTSCGDSQSQLTGELNGKQIGAIDIVCGGFPCQPFSQAGKQRGKTDDRDLWPQMFRIIQETKPTLVIGENVAGFINMELDRTVANLEGEGYEVRVFVLGAVAVQAPHQRQRCWIIGRKRNVGNSEYDGLLTEPELRSDDEASDKRGEKKQETSGQPSGTNRSIDVPSVRRSKCESQRDDVADSECKRFSRGKHEGQSRHKEGLFERSGQDVADSGSTRREAGLPGPNTGKERITKKFNDRDHRQSGGEASDTRSTLGRLGGITDGFPERLDGTLDAWSSGWEDGTPRVSMGEKNRVTRLKQLGNAVVPQVIEVIATALLTIELGGYEADIKK